MIRALRFYGRLWREALGPMPSRATFTARISLIALHTLLCLGMIALFLATGLAHWRAQP